tara:strand:+ start:50 stop:343 length:294 start_codon:yes stop_codon:yes gene_type:complete
MKTKTQVKTKGYKANPKTNWKAKPSKSKRYRRKHDRQWDMTPTWLDKVMSVFKYIIYLTPICCCIIATWSDPSLYNKWMMTAVNCLSLSILIQLTND